MLYDYLHEFAVVAQAGTLSAAAGILGLSEPSLGRHLTALESQLGTKLVQRDAAGVRLLESGRFALDIALDVMALEQAVVQHFSSSQRRTQERNILVGMLDEYTVAKRLLTEGGAALNAAGGNVALGFTHVHTDAAMVDALLCREVDVVVGLSSMQSMLRPSPMVAILPYYDAPVAVALRKEHPLACSRVLTLGELKGCRFSRVDGFGNARTALWNEFRKRCEAAGFTPVSQALRFDNRYGREMRAADEATVCCVDSLEAENLHEAGYTIVPVAGLTLSLVALVRADDALARRLVEEAREIREKLETTSPVDHMRLYGDIAKSEVTLLDPTPGERGMLLDRVTDEPPVGSDLVLPDGTVVDAAYVALRNRLNRIGDGLCNDPVETSYDAIMSLWSVDDAKAELEMPMLRWFTAYDYAATSGRDAGECARILDDFAHRGFVYCANRGGILHYYLLAWVYGIWEFSVRRYDSAFLGRGIYGSDTGARSRYPIMHVCPVSRTVVRDGTMVAYRDWEGYIERQSRACVAPCQCRRAHECLGDGVGADDDTPMDVCLTFGEMAAFWVENSGAREISVEESLAIARHAVYQDGLIPQLYFSQNPEVLCFCRADSCNVLSAVKATGGHANSMAATSAYTLAYDRELCIGCAMCVGRCPMDAVKIDGDEAFAPDATCVACGQCALVCPSGARMLVAKVPKEIAELPSDLLESYQWRSEDRVARGYIADFTGSRLDPWIGMP